MRPRRRTGLVVAASAGGAVLLICILVLALLVARQPGKQRPAAAPATSPGAASPAAPAGSPAVRTLTIPQSAGGYTRATGNVAQRLVAAIRQQAEQGVGTVSKAWAKIYASAEISLYTRNGSGRLIFIGFPTATTPMLKAMQASQLRGVGLDSFFLGAGVPSTTDFPAGPLGGTLRCGATVRSGTPLVMCAWADPAGLGILMEPDTTERGLAGTALAFRAAAEH